MTKIWQDIVNFFTTNGWKIIAVIALIVLGLIAIKIILKLFKRIFRKKKIDDIVSYFITSVINIVLIILLIVAVFDVLGISTAPFVAVLGTVGLALALSIQDSLSNIASGIIIIITKPFRKGDYISVAGIEGSVEKISMLTTELLTYDNKKVVMPNNKVAKSEIINYSHQDIRRLDHKFNVNYGTDISVIKEVIGNVLRNHNKVLKDPEPVIRLAEYSDSSLVFVTKTWVKNSDYWTVIYDINEMVYEAFYQNNIEIPYNKLDVNLYDKK